MDAVAAGQLPHDELGAHVHQNPRDESNPYGGLKRDPEMKGPQEVLTEEQDDQCEGGRH
jgi:Cu/Zn superoxide dismutase